MSSALIYASAILFLVLGSWIFTPFVLILFGLLALSIIVFVFMYLSFYIKELILSDQQPPIIGTLILLLIHFKKLFDYLTLIARRFKTFRFITPSHSEIYTVDPRNVEHILKTNFSNYVKGAYNNGIMKDLFGEGIFAIDGEKWRHQRKLASYEFSTKVLRDFSSSVFRTNAAKVASKLNPAATTSTSFDLQTMLMQSTLDSIFKVGFGAELNSLSGSDDFANKFTKAFDDSNRIVFWRYVDPLWKIKRFLNVGMEASLKKNINIIDDFILEFIRRKREQIRNGMLLGGKEDILSRFLLESEKDPENMTDKYLRDITLNFIIAGKDTSANTLTWFFYLLCKHPLLQEKVAQEVKKAVGIGETETKSASEFSELVTEEALEKMQYLHAALTETLRLYPAVPVVMLRAQDGKCAEEDDVLPDGFKLKKGDDIAYLGYAMGRMTSIWGEDAEQFLPERWLDNGIFRHESPFKFTAFHAGPRMCLGKDFAYRQMKILAAVLVHCFRFKLVDERKEATYQTMFTLHIDHGLHLYVSPRL